jgi:hypothetical protein
LPSEAAKNGGPMLFARMARADFPITQNHNLSRRTNQWFMSYLAFCRANFFMSNPSSKLVEISKLNGDFKKNYGKLIGFHQCGARPYLPLEWSFIRDLFDPSDVVRAPRPFLVMRRMGKTARSRL